MLREWDTLPLLFVNEVYNLKAAGWMGGWIGGGSFFLFLCCDFIF